MEAALAAMAGGEEEVEVAARQKIDLFFFFQEGPKNVENVLPH